MSLVLDHSDYIQAPTRPGGCTIGSGYEELPGLGFCPFCKSHCQEQTYTTFRWDGELFRCETCGWWDLILKEGALDDPYLVSTYLSKDQYRAVLKTFSAADTDVPINALIGHLKANPQTLFSVSARKMEEVVQAVLTDFYHCEVRHVGRTGDGGIDLLVINGNDPIAVQVKRRMEAGKTESVQLIREFLGAVQLRGLKEAMIVSTAYRFTRVAVSAAEQAMERKLVRNYRLVDFPSLVDMLGLKRGVVPEPVRHLEIYDW